MTAPKMSDQELFEKLKREGEYWHENDLTTYSVLAFSRRCKVCGETYKWDAPHPNFSTWEGFGWLWKRMQEKKRWVEFVSWCWRTKLLCEPPTIIAIPWNLIHPTRLPEALKQFMEGRG